MNKQELIAGVIGELMILPIIQKNVLPSIINFRQDILSGCPVSVLKDKYDNLEKEVNKRNKLQYYCKLILANPWVLKDQHIINMSDIEILVTQFSTMDMFMEMNREKLVKLIVMENIIKNMND